ncbi:MAG: metallophosphoesterase [Gammaproteobacteria bacterium]
MRPERLAAAFLLLLLLVSTTAAAPLRVAVISDLNGSYGSTSYAPRIDRAIDRVIELKPDLVISTGDMVAGQRRPHLTRKQVLAMWSAFHRVVSDRLAAAGIPFVVTPGNHDASAYGGFRHEREIYREQWLPRKPKLDFVDDADYPFFYAFDMGGVRFVSLDATRLGPLHGDQMRRLEAVATGREALVTYSHLPLWPFARNREKEVIGDTRLESLYRKTGVDLHLSGHHHAFYPGEKNGILHVSQACLGGGPRKLIGDTQRSRHSFTVVDIDDDGGIAWTWRSEAASRVSQRHAILPVP